VNENKVKHFLNLCIQLGSVFEKNVAFDEAKRAARYTYTTFFGVVLVETVPTAVAPRPWRIHLVHRRALVSIDFHSGTVEVEQVVPGGLWHPDEGKAAYEQLFAVLKSLVQSDSGIDLDLYDTLIGNWDEVKRQLMAPI
jgi:hypothetical protein